MDAPLVAMAVLGFAGAVVMVVLACRDQRRLWYRRAGWQYRYPQLMEPPENVLSANRLGYVASAILLFAVGCACLGSAAEFGSDDGYGGGYNSEIDGDYGDDLDTYDPYDLDDYGSTYP